ncbi:hypothetical protein [Mariniblastus fucicola]|uniref:Uncharacterized protein n=1 Tax=Mariniblastus fucicola TaxID=980251 RepID=A0A5B9P394_9BACT|nr:hypothetical protein [Mariniblastus fucicola]QEG20644.1 hypothetical protein MFFC18_04940 [Mariniblastus fucicola]
MSQSVLEAIRQGKWDYEPDFSSRKKKRFNSTPALPGTEEKVATLAERALLGLPLWHPEDRKTFDDSITGME